MSLEARSLEQDLSGLGPEGFAGRVGLPFRRSGSSVQVHCPFHDDQRPSASLTIGEHGTLRLHCFVCNENWDAHSVVAKVHGLDVRSDFCRVLEREADLLGGILPKSPSSRAASVSRVSQTKPWPDSVELHDLWGRSQHHTGDNRPIDALFREKHWDREIVALHDLARVLPADGPFPPWWPETWASTWRVAARLFDSKGTFRTIQARAIRNVNPKDLFPEDRVASGVFFADDLGQALLRGELLDADGVDVIFAEGLTSWVRACCWSALRNRAAAILGVGSFSTSAYRHVSWPPHGQYFIATDDDEAGHRYAEGLLSTLPRSAPRRRVIFGGHHE